MGYPPAVVEPPPLTTLMALVAPIQPHQTIPYASWHCLRTPLDDAHFGSLDDTALSTWAAPLFNIPGVYGVARIKATKSSLKYGKCHVGILAKQCHVLDTVLEALSVNSEHYHTVLQHKLTGPMDPFSGKEAVTYSWHS